MAMEVSKKLGKEPIAVAEAPLFAVNCILVPMINEAPNFIKKARKGKR